jgi:aspartyl-tRNA synthetase
MVAGFERYFQIARCLRDEDLRADRGFEHTQIDIEISFADREEVMSILEDLMIYIFENLNKKILKKPFPIFTYNQAIEKFGADKFDLRNEKEKKEGQLAFAWVVDFPFFERDQEKKWTFTHNPFSNPKDEYITDLLDKKNIGKILTSQYDLVCNGFEVGGGSIRSNKAEVLERVFEIMGYKKTEIRNKFGHMLEAFSYGAPPHGGCAFGIDRLAMILTNEKYLREVVAFPMTSGGRTSIMDAPSLVTDEQLEELSLKILKKNKIK